MYSHAVRFRQVYRSGHDLLDRRVHQHRGVMGASGNITAYVLSHHDMHNDLQEALRGGNPDTVPLPLAPATIAQRMVFRLFGPRKWLSGSTKLYLLKQATIRPEVRQPMTPVRVVGRGDVRVVLGSRVSVGVLSVPWGAWAAA